MKKHNKGPAFWVFVTSVFILVFSFVLVDHHNLTSQPSSAHYMHWDTLLIMNAVFEGLIFAFLSTALGLMLSRTYAIFSAQYKKSTKKEKRRLNLYLDSFVLFPVFAILLKYDSSTATSWASATGNGFFSQPVIAYALFKISFLVVISSVLFMLGIALLKALGFFEGEGSIEET